MIWDCFFFLNWSEDNEERGYIIYTITWIISSGHMKTQEHFCREYKLDELEHLSFFHHLFSALPF